MNSRRGFYSRFAGSAACALAVAIMGLCDQKPDPPHDSRELVRKVLARLDQIVSGTVVYSREHLVGTKNSYKYRASITLSGPSWVLRALPPTGSGTSLSHGDKSIRYTFTKQRDGSIRHAAQIQLPEAMPEDIRFHLISGSRWNKSTLQFLEKHAADGKRKENQMVGDVECQVWEWTVPKEEASSAFQAVSDLTRNGGALRLWVAPNLGYVVPRIEHVGVDGRVGCRFESRDYHELAAGIYLPRIIRDTNRSSKGILSEFEYVIEKAEKINEPIPESEFMITMPYGTEVLDTRPGRDLAYTITEDLPLSTTGLTDAVNVVARPSFLRRNRAVALVLGAILAIGLFGIVWLRRVARARASK